MIALAEAALFLFFAGVCVMLLFMFLFAPINLVFLAIGLNTDIGEKGVMGLSVATMVLWGFLIIVGGICSAAGWTSLWNASPFGWAQNWLYMRFRHWIGGTYAAMWADFWSYLVTSLGLSFLIVFAVLIYGAVRSSDRAAT